MKSQGVLQDRRFIAFLAILAAVLAIFLVLMLVSPWGTRGSVIATNLSAVVFSGLAFWMFLSVWLATGVRDPSRQIWGLFVLGILLWAIAESIWAYYEVIRAVETPYPSAADFFWVLGYLPLFWGLITRYKSLDLALSPRRKLAALAFISLLFLLIIYFVVRPILLEFDPQRLVESLLNVFYPSGDLVLLILTTLLFLSMGSGRFALTWRFILFGFAVMSLADLCFSYLAWYGLYYPDGQANAASILVDFGFSLSYALLALGIYAYDLLLDLRREITLRMNDSPLAESKILVFIDSKNRVISASNNFMLLTGTQEKSQYEKRPLHEVLGVDEETIAALAGVLQAKGLVSNYSLKTGSAGSKDVLCTAVALFSPQHQYDGAGLVLQTELSSKEQSELPLSEEQKVLVESFLERAGTAASQDARALKAYFLEQIRLIYTLLFEFSGQYVADSLLAFLAHRARQQGWDIRVNGREISIPAEYEGQILAERLSGLLKAGRSYSANVVGLSLIDEEMRRIDRELKPDILEIIDRYGLRIQNQAVLVSKT